MNYRAGLKKMEMVCLAAMPLILTSCFTIGNSNDTAGEAMFDLLNSATEAPSYYSPKPSYGDYRDQKQTDANQQSAKNDSIRKWMRRD